jgi:ribosomal protein S18 acetylase RimI-like enzyme
MEFAHENAKLQPKAEAFLAALYGHMTLTFTRHELHLVMPDIEVPVSGESRPFVGIDQRAQYKILFCSGAMVVWSTKLSFDTEPKATTYMFVDSNTFCVYSGGNDPKVPDLHTREYFRRLEWGLTLPSSGLAFGQPLKSNVRRHVITKSVPPSLVFREVTVETWADFEFLFESKGSPKSCWCMVWRATAEEAKRTDSASRKGAIERRVSSGTPVGILGYLEGKPVAPRSTHRHLVSTESPHDGIWSITCFFVVRRLRGTAIVKQLLAAAVRHAHAHGAKVVESYPVDADSPSYRFMGFVPMFRETGFKELAREGKRRHIMQLSLATAANDA